MAEEYKTSHGASVGYLALGDNPAAFADNSLPGQIRRAEALAGQLSIAVDEQRGALTPVLRSNATAAATLSGIPEAPLTDHAGDLKSALDNIEGLIEDLRLITSRLDV